MCLPHNETSLTRLDRKQDIDRRGGMWIKKVNINSVMVGSKEETLGITQKAWMNVVLIEWLYQNLITLPFGMANTVRNVIIDNYFSSKDKTVWDYTTMNL